MPAMARPEGVSPQGEAAPPVAVPGGWGIAAGLLLATLASGARAALAGRLDTLTTLAPWPEALIQLAWFAGIALAGACYLHALRAASGPIDRRLLGQALLIHLCAAPAMPLTSNDLFSVLAHGRAIERGLDPYRAGPEALPADDPFRSAADPAWASTPSRYGPLALALARVAVASGDVASAALAFKAVMALTGLLCVGLAVPAARAAAGDGGAARGFVLLAWNPLLAWEVSGQAHVDGLVVAAVLVFLILARRGHERVASLCLAGGALVKVLVAPLLGLYLVHLLRHAPRRAVGAAVAMVLALAVACAPFDVGSMLAALPFPLDQLANSLAAVARFVARAAAGAVGADAVAAAWPALAAPALAALAALLAWRTRSLVDAVHGALVFLLLTQSLALGWFMVWYPVLLLPLALAADDDDLAWTVATYTAVAPAMYLPWDGAGVPILLGHGFAALHGLRGLRRRALQSAGSPWS